MRMATVAETVKQNDKGSFFRGLWEMEGDNMGGPFVSRRVKARDGKSMLTIEGFIFAPGKNKRNALRQLEASLLSANRVHGNKVRHNNQAENK